VSAGRSETKSPTTLIDFLTQDIDILFEQTHHLCLIYWKQQSIGTINYFITGFLKHTILD
jgi:hypothetical protein